MFRLDLMIWSYQWKIWCSVIVWIPGFGERIWCTFNLTRTTIESVCNLFPYLSGNPCFLHTRSIFKEYCIAFAIVKTSLFAMFLCDYTKSGIRVVFPNHILHWSDLVLHILILVITNFCNDVSSAAGTPVTRLIELESQETSIRRCFIHTSAKARVHTTQTWGALILSS